MSSLTAPRLRFRRGERGRLGGERGQSVIEFALILPFVLLIVLGMLDLGKAMHYRNDMTHLANEAARLAAVNKNPGEDAVPPVASLEEYIRLQGTSEELREGGEPGGEGTTTGPLEVEICFPHGVSEYQVGDPVKAIVRSEYKWLSILGIGITQELVGTSTMRIERAWVPGDYGPPIAPGLACP